MKKTIFILAITALIAACSGNSTKESATTTDTTIVDSIMGDTIIVDSVIM